MTSLGDFDKIIGQSLCSQTAIPDQNRLHIQSARAISLCEITQMLCTMLTTAELIEVTFWKNNKWKLLVAALIVLARPLSAALSRAEPQKYLLPVKIAGLLVCAGGALIAILG